MRARHGTAGRTGLASPPNTSDACSPDWRHREFVGPYARPHLGAGEERESHE